MRGIIFLLFLASCSQVAYVQKQSREKNSCDVGVRSTDAKKATKRRAKKTVVIRHIDYPTQAK